MNNKLDFLWSVKIRPVAKLIFKIVFQQVFELSSSSHRFTPWGGCWLLAASLFHYHLNLSWSLNKASSGETGGSWSARLRRVNLPGWYHLWDRRAWGFEEIQEQCKAGDVMRAEKQKKPVYSVLLGGYCIEMFLSENEEMFIFRNICLNCFQISSINYHCAHSGLWTKVKSCLFICYIFSKYRDII